MHLAVVRAESDTAGLQRDVAGILTELFFSPAKPSVAWAFFRAINSGAARRIGFPADPALFGRAIVTTEAMGRRLYPDFDLNREMRPFVEKALKAYLAPERALKGLRADLFDHLEFVRSLPEHARRLLQTVDKGELSVKLDTTELLGIKKEFDRQNDLRILGVGLVAVFLALVVLLYLEGKRTFAGLAISKIALIVFAGLLVWFVVKILSKPKA